MPRNANGVYSLPILGNPVLPATKISSAWINATLADIAAALTASLSIDGSVTPEKLSNNPAGFMAKIAPSASSIASRTAALESRNDAEIGSLAAFPLSDVPDNYLPCDGGEAGRVSHAKLFAKIGVTYGNGDTTTTFNVPDLRGETIRGWDHGRGIDGGRNIGTAQTGIVAVHDHTASSATADAHDHTATTAAGGEHNHTASASTDGGHTHPFSATSGDNSANHTHTFSLATSSSGAHNHTFHWTPIATANTGSPSTNSFDTSTTLATNTTGAHTHTASGTTGDNSATHTHTWSTASAASGVHSHAITVDDSLAHDHEASATAVVGHTHNVTVDEAGGESRVYNMALQICIKFE